MSTITDRQKSPTGLYVIGFLLLAVIGLFAFGFYRKQRYDSTRNYAVSWAMPNGWRQVPNAPSDLFHFIDPKTGVVMRGGQTQVVDSMNPSADMTSDSTADDYVDRLKRHMPDWTIEKLKDAPGQGINYGVIKRTTKGKEVLDAFLVKGNTTIIITFYGAGDSTKYVDQELPVFYSFLGTTALHEKNYGL